MRRGGPGLAGDGRPVGGTRPGTSFVWMGALLLAACGGSEGGDPPSRFRPLAVGDPAPAYQAVSLAGDTVRLAELRGEVVVLNVWATWCHPCREEMPALQRLHEELGPLGVRVVGVSVDGRSSAHLVPTFLEEVGVTFDILRDPEERVVRAFTTIGVPETFLIGRDGVVLHRWIGPFDPLEPVHRARVEAALRG